MPRKPKIENDQEKAQLADKIALEKQQGVLLDELTKDFERLQRQKSRKKGGVEARILLSCAFDWGEQYVTQQERGISAEVQEPNKLYLVFNFIAQYKQQLIGRLNATGLQFGAQPSKKDPKSLGDAEVVEKLIRGLDKKLEQASRNWELFDWLAKGGVAFEYTPWIPNATIEPVAQYDDATGELLFKDTLSGEILPQSARDMAMGQGVPQERFEVYEEPALEGEVGSEILSPLCVFIDQSVRAVEDLAPDQRVYIARIKTRGWIEEQFGEEKVADIQFDKELKIVTTALLQEGDSAASMFLKDMIPTVQGECEEDDPDMAVVVEAYLPQSKKYPMGRQHFFIPGKKVLFDDNNNAYNGDIPLTDFHFGPVTTTFWTKDYITDQIAPQRFFNKRMSQMGEQSNGAIYDTILLGGNLVPGDIPADRVGAIKGGISESGMPNAVRMPGPQLPVWFLESIKIAQQAGRTVAGGADITENSKFPGQLRGPMAVPMIQEIMDSEFGPLYFHIAARMARVKQQRLNRVKKYYPALRTLHFTDRNQRDEVLEFHAEKILRSGTSYSIFVEPSTVIPELRSLREARVRERLQSPLSILYMDERTGHLDKSKIAMDLRQGDYGREDRESQSRKFAQQLIEKMWKAQPVPPVQQFWDHEHMLDELEGEMMTTEFLSASQQVQQLFQGQYQQHIKFLQQKAQMQQQSMQNQMIHSAVAQAVQQAAATTAAETIDIALHQGLAMREAQPDPQQLVQAQVQAQQQQPGPGPAMPPMPPMMRPPQPQPGKPQGKPAPRPMKPGPKLGG